MAQLNSLAPSWGIITNSLPEVCEFRYASVITLFDGWVPQSDHADSVTSRARGLPSILLSPRSGAVAYRESLRG